jgi:hypothetical protein
MYVFYRHRRDPARELVLRDGALFPHHLHKRDWYVHGTHASVNGRTEADIEMLGFCDRSGGGATFGRRVASHTRLPLTRRSVP